MQGILSTLPSSTIIKTYGKSSGCRDEFGISKYQFTEFISYLSRRVVAKVQANVTSLTVRCILQRQCERLMKGRDDIDPGRAQLISE